MPQRPRLRDSVDSVADGPKREMRRTWLATWKRWAMNALPAEASRAVRVRVRTAVERALVRLGPEDDEAEVRDVVACIVEETHGQLQGEADCAAQTRSKREIVNGAGALLAAVLPRFPKNQVAAMLKRPGLSLVALTGRLQRFVDRHLTGNERPEQIVELVTAWVERRLAEQPPVPAASGRLAAGVGTAVGVIGSAGVVALQHPQVRDAAVRHLKTARDKARGWLQTLIPPQPPAPPGPGPR